MFIKSWINVRFILIFSGSLQSSQLNENKPGNNTHENYDEVFIRQPVDCFLCIWTLLSFLSFFLLHYLFNMRLLPHLFTLPGRAFPSVRVSNALEGHWIWLTPAVVRTRLTQRVVIGIQIPAGSEKVTEGVYGRYGVVSAGWLISDSMITTSCKLQLFPIFLSLFIP